MYLTALTPVNYPTHIGNRQIFVGTGTGPTLYSSTGTDTITLPYQFQIDSVLGPAVSTDGTTIAVPYPTTAGNPSTWVLRYYTFTAATGAWGAETGANLSTKTFQLAVLGGVL
jgi:hypothetical protein